MAQVIPAPLGTLIFALVPLPRVLLFISAGPFPAAEPEPRLAAGWVGDCVALKIRRGCYGGEQKENRASKSFTPYLILSATRGDGSNRHELFNTHRL
ncbi:hypothetical protein JB92DRAFT_3014898 [Gautieria morchelliformis]|nr:hypothetical protein JB92DRAFT_3014898 [Gautieria morchelliformis]